MSFDSANILSFFIQDKIQKLTYIKIVNLLKYIINENSFIELYLEKVTYLWKSKVILTNYIVRSCYATLVLYESKDSRTIAPTPTLKLTLIRGREFSSGAIVRIPNLNYHYLNILARTYLVTLQSYFSMQLEPFFNVECEAFYLQALCLCRNAYFVSLCWDDAVTWKKIITGKRDSSFVKARCWLWKTSRLAGTG